MRENNDKNYSVYKHTFPNGKIYIGITKTSPENRWNKGYGYMGQELIMGAIIEYGWRNIKHEVLYSNLSKDEAREIESKLIKELKSYNRDFGYNILVGDYALQVLEIDISNYAINKREKSQCKPVLCVETNKIYDSFKQAGEEVGILPAYISNVCNGRGKTAGGYHWVALK